MSGRDYVFVTNGLHDWDGPKRYVRAVNGLPHSDGGYRMVYVVNRMGGKKPSTYEYVCIVNDGLHPGTDAQESVYIENPDDLPLYIRIEWGMVKCPRCGGSLRDLFGFRYGCDRCRITWNELELERYSR